MMLCVTEKEFSSAEERRAATSDVDGVSEFGVVTWVRAGVVAAQYEAPLPPDPSPELNASTGRPTCQAHQRGGPCAEPVFVSLPVSAAHSLARGGAHAHTTSPRIHWLPAWSRESFLFDAVVFVGCFVVFVGCLQGMCTGPSYACATRPSATTAASSGGRPCPHAPVG